MTARIQSGHTTALRDNGDIPSASPRDEVRYLTAKATQTPGIAIKTYKNAKNQARN
jgi:hypothetical protein